MYLKSLIMLLIFGFSATGLIAQDGRYPADHGKKKMANSDRAEARLAKMTSELELSEEQVEQVRALMIDNRAKMKDNREAMRESSEKRRAAMSDYNTQLQEILTPEQYEEYKKHRAEERKRNMAKRKSREMNIQDHTSD